MKRLSKNLALALLTLALLTACSEKVYIATPCASIEPLDRVPDINITTDATGGLDAKNAHKLFTFAVALRASEGYYLSETLRLKEANYGRLRDGI